MIFIKREDTKVIEKVLLKSCFGSNPKLATDYGTTEVTIDFQRNGNGRELVDFLSYNPKKDIFKCYEIKVTIEDFYSDAKKSWYGHYNYLAISEELYIKMTLDEWKRELPKGVGIIVINTNTEDKQTVLKASKNDVTNEVKDMLKNSLIRSIFYQNIKKSWYLRNLL